VVRGGLGEKARHRIVEGGGARRLFPTDVVSCNWRKIESLGIAHRR
jgi:hypothetical protein